MNAYLYGHPASQGADFQCKHMNTAVENIDINAVS